MKRKDEESTKKQDLPSRARESYGSSRYRPGYRPRSNTEAGGHPYPGAGHGLYSRAGYTPYPAASYNQYQGNGMSTSSSFSPYNSFQGQVLQAPGPQGGWIATPQDGFPPTVCCATRVQRSNQLSSRRSKFVQTFPMVHRASPSSSSSEPLQQPQTTGTEEEF